MVKILPLKTIFENYLKKSKMLVKNYCPISLLPIFVKSFQRVIDNALFNYFQSHRSFTITPSQSGFLPEDSCIAQ